jgi:hypothetical protein
MHFLDYKGYTIYPEPKLSLESHTWEAILSIRKGNKVETVKTECLFKTKGEAFFHSISMGKKIIDGEIDEFMKLPE